MRDTSHDDGVPHGDFLEMLEVFGQAPGHVARESDRAVLSVRNDDCKLSHSVVEKNFVRRNTVINEAKSNKFRLEKSC